MSKKILPEELKTFEELQSKYVLLAIDLGENELQLSRLNKALQEIQNERETLIKRGAAIILDIESLQDTADNFKDTLSKKYGENISIDPNTGEITAAS
jgi:chromosome segregation ATPase